MNNESFFNTQVISLQEEYRELETSNSIDLPKPWLKTNTGNKITSCALPRNFVTEKITVLGGICSVFTGDSEVLRKKELSFRSETDFKEWLKSWYPRVDQIHDTVGLPAKATKEIKYVCEDSFFARRIANWQGLDQSKLTDIFREVHEEQADPLIKNWIRKQGGYKGEVTVVYTSELEKPINTALRVWERLNEFKFKSKLRERAKINLMYTALWLDVLEVDGQAVVYEPEQHGIEFEFFPKLKPWMQANPYGYPGINENIGLVGFEAFSSSAGITRNSTFDSVPNIGNWENFSLREEDALSYARNFFPQIEFRNREDLPSDTSLYEQIESRIKMDLENIYGGQ